MQFHIAMFTIFVNAQMRLSEQVSQNTRVVIFHVHELDWSVATLRLGLRLKKIGTNIWNKFFKR